MVFPSQHHRLCAFLSTSGFGPGDHFEDVRLRQDFATNTYTGSSEEPANPERGFYIQADSYASALRRCPRARELPDQRESSPGNTYTAKISLLLRLFYSILRQRPHQPHFLNAIQAISIYPTQGCKAVVRFAYNQDQTSPTTSLRARILAHIEQLKPLLKQNGDVTRSTARIIGAWGEGYYTDIFILPDRPPRRTD
jgi:hypothetical protein